MSNQHEQPPLHADWKTEPAKHGITPQIRRSGFVAYIIGTGANVNRYCRTVKLPSDDQRHCNGSTRSLSWSELLDPPFVKNSVRVRIYLLKLRCHY